MNVDTIAGTRSSAAKRFGYRVAVLGHFGHGNDHIDGQVMRTRVVFEQFSRRLPKGSVCQVDTSRLSRHPFATYRALRKAVLSSEHVVFMPAERGLRWLLPHYVRWCGRTGGRLHYLVVGGWLPRFLSEQPKLLRHIAKIDGMYVQSAAMAKELMAMGVGPAHVLPNFREFPPPSTIHRDPAPPLAIVFYSRVIPEKGVELAIDAIRACNSSGLEPRVRLDIWGPVPERYQPHFERKLAGLGDTVRYRGVLRGASVYQVLPEYDALVFPTTYEGEGFPGAILDAYSCGLPVIASDWRYNSEFVQHGHNGLLVEAGAVTSLETALRQILDDPFLLPPMRRNAGASALPYHTDIVFPGLMARMGLELAEEITSPPRNLAHLTSRETAR